MNLADPRERRARDPSGMLELILRLPEMCAEAWALPVQPSPPALRPAQIIALGMGGSGIGGDLLRAVLHDEASMPVMAIKEYRPPAFVGPECLVFACSYSGNTEETLAAYDEASARGASCVVITSGGELLRRAEARRHPAVVVPPGLPPRAALPYLFLPMLAILSRAGIVRSFDAEVGETVAGLRRILGRLGPEGADPEARALAGALVGRIPVVYSSTPFLEPAAQRWKDQFNENAKTFAVWNTFPELNHNETVGWGLDPALARTLYVIVLRDPSEPARLARRVEITKDLAFRKAAGVAEVAGEGEGKLCRLMSPIAYGDLVSWYLALQRGVDPTPVAVIDELKQRLAASASGGPP
ncbi:MAG: bifunctional phosphoglucose/phosphomannose isomerase [Armatimonadota bacterium]|nr:bifunctional phosphoglucose/phosphomannose isomerase [Armatimonadota bacterium]MDR7499878.1 bifunctional phosphoglucose/phosphomannose isomerase [Armatimonadota bacterium]MDR7504488.1 bifunctional phosphoglucose/phosphomannose isomerase [Armatimonadota bacterium]MDR7558405.1 bifunctional phosphoglucose/phosphomannose isomerase [Armatimonadota bacterium]MDR7572185.1 bifunctional phosphoglucose/phosphomannose isomerase [Armatimonadota bacterium]